MHRKRARFRRDLVCASRRTSAQFMKIGLLDHMGYGNLGDAATQDTVIANVGRRLPGAQIVGFSLVPRDTTKRHGIPCYPIRRYIWTSEKTGDQVSDQPVLKSKLKSTLKRNRLVYMLVRPFSQFAHELMFWMRSYRVLRTLDIVIISGGGQLDDVWPDQPYTVFVFALLTRLARKKLYLLNVGVGPLRRKLDKIFAKWITELAHYRSVRDRDSQERLLDFGASTPTNVYPDLVYSLEVEGFARQTPVSQTRPIVGLNPMGFCDPRIWPRKDDAVYQRYINKLITFSLWLFDHGYDLRLFTTDVGVDRLALEDLRTQLCSGSSWSKLAGRVYQAPSEGVSDVLREMAGYDFIVTSKFHGIIFSHLLGKPVISLSYHRKMDFAMQAVGQGEFCADIEHFDADWLKRALSSLVSQSSSIKRQYAVAVEKNATKLSQQFDSLFPRNKPDDQTFPGQILSEGVENCGLHSEAQVGK